MRQVINTKQKNNTQYYAYKGKPVLFSKKDGYKFSDHPAMDEMVNYFLSLDGFKLVTAEKKEQPKQQPKEQKKEHKKEFKKEEKVKEVPKKEENKQVKEE